jgi:serine/threonine-protein kinase
VLVAICTDPIPDASSLVPALGPEVDRFFARALVRDPAHRFQSARELLDAFAALAGMPRKTSLVDSSETESAKRFDAMFAETAVAPSAHHVRDDAKPQPSPAIKLADPPPPSSPEGTFAASGRTQQQSGEHRTTHGARKTLLAVAVLSIAAIGWAVNRSTPEPLQARDDGPGSPTLPLPPPTADPATVAPTPQLPALPAPPAPEDEAKIALAVPQRAADATARSDKPAAGAGRRAPVRAPSPAPTSGKVAGEVAQPGPADDAKELGL